MKNFFTALTLFTALLLLTHQSRAITITINVGNNFFDPAFVNANVGDEIMWKWMEGFHTTTSDTVPAGADMWEANINDNSTTFSYIIAVAGHYHYFCEVHGQMQSGVIEASDPTGIPALSLLPVSSITITNVSANGISINYRLIESQQTNVALFNLAGNKTVELVDQVLPAGDYSGQYQLSGTITSGVYFLIIESGNLRLTRKIVIQ
ncbi:MAG: T9SS type A sorting domain-containing protein [Chitinophagales bacterium]